MPVVHLIAGFGAPGFIPNRAAISSTCSAVAAGGSANIGTVFLALPVGAVHLFNMRLDLGVDLLRLAHKHAVLKLKPFFA